MTCPMCPQKLLPSLVSETRINPARSDVRGPDKNYQPGDSCWLLWYCPDGHTIWLNHPIQWVL